MNFKTTIALLILVAAGAALYYVGPRVPSLLEKSTPPPAEGGTRAVLEKLKPAELTRIEIQSREQTLILTRDKDGWNMPGKWPTRTDKIKALVEMLGGLRSRFLAVPLASDADLSHYGLQKRTVTVKLETENAKYHFVLGEAPSTEETDQFSQPTFLRLVSGPGVEQPAPEVVRLPPGLLALLEHSADYYQQRRLFRRERVAKDDDPNVKVERLIARRVRVEESKKEPGPDGKKKEATFTLEHNEKTNQWELATPERDRLEPAVEEALLKALPDLWAEQFVNLDVNAIRDAVAGGNSFANSATALGVLALPPDKAAEWLLARSGLAAPERKIVVTHEGGDQVTLLIGNGFQRKKSTGTPTMFDPGDQSKTEEFRYAKLEGNPQIFEIKAAFLKDIFVAPDTLRDPRLARFTPAQAQEVEIAQSDGKETIRLVKEKDQWKLVKPLVADADAAIVTELLTALSGLQVRGEDVIAPDKHDPVAQGFDKPGITISVKWETEKEVDGEKKKTQHSTTLKLGKDDIDKKKLYVKTDDWPRVNTVDDSLMSLVKREAVAYRGKRLLDFTAADVDRIDVQRGGDKLAFKQDKGEWKLVAPVAAKVDAGKVLQLLDLLGHLEVLEYENDRPTKEDLDQKYGVGDMAALVVKVTFSDSSKPARTLRLGKTRGTKPEFYGKMDDGTAVFVVDGLIRSQLDRDSLAYLPTELWRLQPNDITGVRIKREGQDEYTLKRDDARWLVTGPFDAPAMPQMVQFLLRNLATARVEKYEAHEAKDLAMYGLDKPALTVTVLGKDGKEKSTLLIGKLLDKDSQSHYAKLSDQDAICVIGSQVTVATDRPALDMLDPALLHLDPAKVQRVTTNKGGDASLTLERKDDGWHVLDTPAGPFVADKNAAALMEFLWGDLEATKFADYGAKVDWAKYGLDKPDVVITVAMKDGEPKEHIVELGKHVEGTSGPRYARVDKGPGVAVLGESEVRMLTRPYLEYVNRSVLQFKVDEVTQIQRKKGTELLDVIRKGDGWQIVKPAEQRADDKSLQDLVTQLANLKAVRVAAFPAKDLKTYGLDDPDTLLVTIKLKADATLAEYVVKVGKPTEADATQRYAIVGDSKAVVVLSAALSKRLAAAPITFRDLSIARFTDADKLQLERGPRKAVFARVDGSWKLTEPLAAEADNDELDEFLNTLAKLRADELVAEKPTADELKSYGLDKPEARWKLTAGDQEVLNLVIGGHEKDGVRRYAQLAGKDVVFLLDPKLSARSLAEFRSRTVWPMPLDAFQVESVRYGYTKNPFVLEKTQTGWEVADKPDLKPNTATVNETLAALAGLKVSRYIVDKGADFKLFGLEPPELTIEVATRTGKRTLYIGRAEGDTKRLYARIADKDRTDVFVIDEADAAKILRDAAAFTKAPERPMPPLPPPPMP